MSAKTDARELAVARWINQTSEGVYAKRTTESTAFSDIWVKRDGYEPCYIEVKQEHKANIVNPRFTYRDKKWDTTYTQYSAQVVVDTLNASWEAKQFMRELADFCEVDGDTMIIPTSKAALKEPNCIPCEDIIEFFQTRTNKYVCSFPEFEIADMITKDYNLRNAHYMQVDDDIYLIGHTNPLGLPDDMPVVEGRGTLKVRFSLRSMHWEMQAEVKLGVLLTSHYSCMPNTTKLNPFQ